MIMTRGAPSRIKQPRRSPRHGEYLRWSSNRQEWWQMKPICGGRHIDPAVVEDVSVIDTAHVAGASLRTISVA